MAHVHATEQQPAVRQWVWTILREGTPRSPFELWRIAKLRGAKQMGKTFASAMSVMHRREHILQDSGQMGAGDSQVLASVRLEIPPHLRHLDEPPAPPMPPKPTRHFEAAPPTKTVYRRF